MTQIHYFPRYSQRENFETNNTLLLLHRLYDFNRLRFSAFLSSLLRNSNAEAWVDIEFGLQIRQQISTQESVVDGYLYQDFLRIAIETKREAASFSIEQINRHLDAFTQSATGFMLLLSRERVAIDRNDWEAIRTKAAARNVIILPVSFEDIIEAARNCLNDYDEHMLALVNDYEDFCSQSDLLPIDRWTLFVPPCGQSHDINIASMLYFCPASWSRRKAKFLGIYYDKAVRYIGAISKTTEMEISGESTISDAADLTNIERDQIAKAVDLAREKNGWNITTGHQFFLCTEMLETHFDKTSRGGIMGHRYFDLRSYFPGNTVPSLATIADGLRHHTWE